MSSRSLKLAGVTALAAASLVLSACGGQGNAGAGEASGVSGTVTIDGSSTVAPLSEAAADLFRDVESGVERDSGHDRHGRRFPEVLRRRN